MQRQGFARIEVWMFVGTCLVAGCGSSVGGLMPDGGSDPPDGGTLAACEVQDPATCPEPAPHYADVAPIFEQRCNGCHSEASEGPWPLTSYQNIADWEDVVRIDLVDCSMPPADGGVTMTSDERMALLTWIRCGLPE